MVQGSGIYQADVQRAKQEALNRGVIEESGQTANTDALSLLLKLVANARAQNLSHSAPLERSAIDQEYVVLQHQLRPEAAWLKSLHANGLSRRALRREIATGLGARRWLEQRVASQTQTTADECLQYYQAHRPLFWQPARFRVSHLFLAAPPETAPEIVEAKRDAMKAFSERLAHGEKLADLANLASEDETTKGRGGDLNYFSESRMPSDFFNAIKALPVGEISPVISTRLGFHIVQVTDKKPGREMTFEESAAEIRLTLQDSKRRVTSEALRTELGRQSDFVAFLPL
jgi:parvulin-like peptidyl-prolyl isomerase